MFAPFSMSLVLNVLFFSILYIYVYLCFIFSIWKECQALEKRFSENILFHIHELSWFLPLNRIFYYEKKKKTKFQKHKKNCYFFVFFLAFKKKDEKENKNRTNTQLSIKNFKSAVKNRLFIILSLVYYENWGGKKFIRDKKKETIVSFSTFFFYFLLFKN